MKRKSHRLKNTKRLQHTNPMLRYGGAMAPNTKSSRRLRSKQTRVSARSAGMDGRAKEIYDNNCYFFKIIRVNSTKGKYTTFPVF